MNQAKEVMNELISEIELMDPKTFSVNNDMEKGDKELYLIDDDFIKKIYCLAQFYAREKEQLKVSLKYDEETEEKKADYRKFAGKESLLRKMFWIMIREKYDVWGSDNIGIRRDWKLVSSLDDPSDGIQGILGHLLGGQ